MAASGATLSVQRQDSPEGGGDIELQPTSAAAQLLRRDSGGLLDTPGGGLAPGQAPPFPATPVPPQSWLARAWMVLLCGSGFMADAYDLFVVNTVLLIMEQSHPPDAGGQSFIAAGATAGAIVGQLVFGVLADSIGRRAGFIATLSIIAAGAAASAGAVPLGRLSVYGTLGLARLFLGVGIGGEYPLSATVAAEESESARRGRAMAAVFSMQGVGMLLAPCLGLAVLAALPAVHLDAAWRILLALGALPAVAMLPARCRMRETRRFTRARAKGAATAAAAGGAGGTDTWRIIASHWRQLAAAAGGWFLFDIYFYSQGLFSGVMIEALGFVPALPPDASAQAREDHVFALVRLNALLVLGALPGYAVATALIDSVGRRRLQLAGNLGMAVLYGVIGGTAGWLSEHAGAFFALYALSFAVAQLPNVTTFVLPSELFPTEVRATCHGLAAAAGKLGAVVGAAGLRPLLDAGGIQGVMFACAGVALAAAALTYALVPETAGRSLEALQATLPQGAMGGARGEEGEEAEEAEEEEEAALALAGGRDSSAPVPVV